MFKYLFLFITLVLFSLPIFAEEFEGYSLQEVCDKFEVTGCERNSITKEDNDIAVSLPASLVHYRPSAVGKTNITGSLAHHRDTSAAGVTATHALTEKVLIGGGAAKAEGRDDWLFNVNGSFEF